MTRSADIANQYFDCVRSRDVDSLVELFAVDACIILPGGRTLEGRNSIASMYHHLFATSPPKPQPYLTIEEGSYCAVEVESRVGEDETKRTINVFQMDEGQRIIRLAVYAQ